jgi:hypothetical protein
MLLAVQLALVGAATVAAWRRRNRGPELPIAIGISASLLVTPYVGFQDFLMLAVAAWLVLRVAPSALAVVTIGSAYLALEFGLVFGTLPVVISELALLAVTSVASAPQVVAAGQLKTATGRTKKITAAIA